MDLECRSALAKLVGARNVELSASHWTGRKRAQAESLRLAEAVLSDPLRNRTTVDARSGKLHSKHASLFSPPTTTMSLNPKKIWKKLRSKGSKKSASSSQRPSSDSSVVRSGTIDHPLDHAAHATSSVALATVGSQFPSQSRGQPSLLPPSVPTLHSSQNPITSNNNQSSNTSSGVREEPGLGATVYSGVKLVLDVAKESADVFPPLKAL